MNTIYTIGYATIPAEEFTAILQRYGVTTLIDVRSIPYSRFYPQFNAPSLTKRLATANICYENLKTEFGARQENPAWFTDGYLDYQKFAASEPFQRGIKHTLDLSQHYETVCLMCAEKDPATCHRAILCSKELAPFADIQHIRYDKGQVWLESHAVLEQRINSDYAKVNAKIGYRKN